MQGWQKAPSPWAPVQPELTDPSLTSSCACPLGKPPAAIRRETCPLKLTVFGGWGGGDTPCKRNQQTHMGQGRGSLSEQEAVDLGPLGM